MKMSNEELTRQDEDLVAREFDAEEEHDEHRFKNWPEFAGLIFTIFVVWLIFAFRG